MVGYLNILAYLKHHYSFKVVNETLDWKRCNPLCLLNIVGYYMILKTSSEIKVLLFLAVGYTYTLCIHSIMRHSALYCDYLDGRTSGMNLHFLPKCKSNGILLMLVFIPRPRNRVPFLVPLKGCSYYKRLVPFIIWITSVI